MNGKYFRLTLLSCAIAISSSGFLNPGEANAAPSLEKQIKTLSRKIKAIESKVGTAGTPGLPGLKGDKGDRGEKGLKGDKGDNGIAGVSPDPQAVAAQAAALTQPSISATSSRVDSLEQYRQSTVAPQLDYLMQEMPYYAALGQSMQSELSGSPLPAGIPDFFPNSKLDRLEQRGNPSVSFELGNHLNGDQHQCAIVNMEARGCFTRQGCTIRYFRTNRDTGPKVDWFGPGGGNVVAASSLADISMSERVMTVFRKPLSGEFAYATFKSPVNDLTEGGNAGGYKRVRLDNFSGANSLPLLEARDFGWIPHIRFFSGITTECTAPNGTVLNELPPGENQITAGRALNGQYLGYLMIQNDLNGNLLVEIIPN